MSKKAQKKINEDQKKEKQKLNLKDKHKIKYQEKNNSKKNLDPFTNANDIQNAIVDKKKGKRSPTEKKRFDRQQQKEIVRQLTTELIKISEKDMLDEIPRESNERKHTNEVIYTIKPVSYDD